MQNKPPGAVGGAHTYIDRDRYLKPVAKKYGRDPASLCLKISYGFFMQPGETLETKGWAGSPLPVLDCTRMQNICHFKGLAPRVYAVDIIDWEGHKTVAQLQDYVGEGEGVNKPLFRKVAKVVDEYGGIILERGSEGGTWNSAGGKWVGFKSMGWKDKTIYKQKVKKIIYEDEIDGISIMEVANFLGEFNLDYQNLVLPEIEQLFERAAKKI